MRLAVLSEIPGEWEAALARWIRLDAAGKREADGAPAPDIADEVMLYQMLVAAWPLGLDPADAPGLKAFRERMWQWQEKALREGKRHSSWAAPREAYETACASFLDHVLDPSRPARVVHEIAAFAARISPAGCLNSLSQTLLRLTTPGVPDLYQGTEFWDFSLVDPDNRRPVDFAEREAALGAGKTPAELMATWRDGRVKQAVIAQALAYRREAETLFAHGTYTPLEVEGRLADQAVAFLRSHDDQSAIVIVSRLAANHLGEDGVPLIPFDTWQGTALNLPRAVVGRRLVDRMGCADLEAAPENLPIADALACLPIALLELR